MKSLIGDISGDHVHAETESCNCPRAVRNVLLYKTTNFCGHCAKYLVDNGVSLQEPRIESFFDRSVPEIPSQFEMEEVVTDWTFQEDNLKSQPFAGVKAYANENMHVGIAELIVDVSGMLMCDVAEAGRLVGLAFEHLGLSFAEYETKDEYEKALKRAEVFLYLRDGKTIMQVKRWFAQCIKKLPEYASEIDRHISSLNQDAAKFRCSPVKNIRSLKSIKEGVENNELRTFSDVSRELKVIVTNLVSIYGTENNAVHRVVTWMEVLFGDKIKF